jgi:hypothetical protein
MRKLNALFTVLAAIFLMAAKAPETRGSHCSTEGI